jgi:endonuclease YncB( thermonuclease family)
MMVGFAAGAWVMTELTAPPPRPKQNVTVRAPFLICGAINAPNCVIDGDTIRYRGESIRIENIDAPEVFSPGCIAEKAMGELATLRLAQLLNQGPFEIVDDGGRDRDKYGRKLRVLKRNGQPLGDILVAEGLARSSGFFSRSWCWW